MTSIEALDYALKLMEYAPPAVFGWDITKYGECLDALRALRAELSEKSA